MNLNPSPEARRLAQSPHNIFIVGLFAFDLFMKSRENASKMANRNIDRAAA